MSASENERKNGKGEGVREKKKKATYLFEAVELIRCLVRNETPKRKLLIQKKKSKRDQQHNLINKKEKKKTYPSTANKLWKAGFVKALRTMMFPKECAITLTNSGLSISMAALISLISPSDISSKLACVRPFRLEKAECKE